MPGEKTQVEILDERGPWPFITRRTFRFPDGSVKIWSSRHHRKGLEFKAPIQKLLAPELIFRNIWMPRNLNWWIGLLFAIGSTLFILGSVLSLWPGVAADWSLSFTAINGIFFCGSIPFTTAAYLQLFQAAQAASTTKKSEFENPLSRWIGWYPSSAGWLSTILQFLGTLLFNLNTFDAFLPSLNWLGQDFLIWVPDFLGSLLFLASGYLAYVEFGHSHWSWEPESISWWVVAINLSGCLFFMVSAFFAFVSPVVNGSDGPIVSLTFTLFGAFCFLCGSILMLPEAAGDALSSV